MSLERKIGKKEEREEGWKERRKERERDREKERERERERKKMGLKQFSQPIFCLPECFTNFRAQQPPEV